MGEPVQRGVRTLRVGRRYSPLGNPFRMAGEEDREAACDATVSATCAATEANHAPHNASVETRGALDREDLDHLDREDFDHLPWTTKCTAHAAHAFIRGTAGKMNRSSLCGRKE